MASSVDTWLKNWRSIINFNYIRDRLDFKFLKDIIRLSVFEYKNPMSPWITIEMIKILENYLKEGDIGFEFGSGSSTIWLAKKTYFFTILRRIHTSLKMSPTQFRQQHNLRQIQFRKVV